MELISQTIHGSAYVHMRKAKEKEYTVVVYSDPHPQKNIQSQQFFNQLSRVATHQIVFHPNEITPYRELKTTSSGMLVWDPSFSDAWGRPVLIYGSGWRSVWMLKYGWDAKRQGESLLRGMFPETDPEKLEARVHDKQTPVELWMAIFEKMAYGSHILDLTPNGGSLRIACDKLGLHYTGIERYRANKQINDKRFFKYKRTPELFYVERIELPVNGR